MTDPGTWSRPAPSTIVPRSGEHVHLIGIGGAGMRGLARLLLDRGLTVTGSDRDPTSVRGLPSEIRVVDETELAAVRTADLVVYSAAVSEDHPKMRAAAELGIPRVKRASALGALLNDRRLVGIAGTHGKTTVTAMTAIACEAGGLDTTAVVGGRVPAWNGSTRQSAGEVAVVEADEFDRSFLQLDPSLAVVTAVEPEHLECYGSFEVLVDAFVTFASRAHDRDGVLVCADDPMAVRVGQRAGGALSYGFDDAADWRVRVLEVDRSGQTCRLTGPNGDFQFRVGSPGRHNAQNAAAALVSAVRLGASEPALADALAGFTGVERRLQILASDERRVIVDDYAHHPTEVRASIEALRAAYPAYRLFIVFQPHLYSRTQDMADAFAEALADADEAVVLPIYPSRERPIPGVTSNLIAAAAPDRVSEGDMSTVADRLAGGGTEPIVIVFMGAGDITHLAHHAARGLDELGN